MKRKRYLLPLEDEDISENKRVPSRTKTRWKKIKTMEYFQTMCEEQTNQQIEEEKSSVKCADIQNFIGDALGNREEPWIGNGYGRPVCRGCPAGDPGTVHGGGDLGLRAADGPATEDAELALMALQPVLLHPGLKSRSDTASHLSLKGQGGMVDAQALRTEGVPVLLRDVGPAGSTGMESSLARHHLGVFCTN
ncbi:UNVERIFIED_CONTAM: hypothetical protein FKN15_036460 [Acipenser sinensis]